METTKQDLHLSVLERATLRHIPLSEIEIYKNPREYFDPVEDAQMDDSVRSVGGILQPVLLRDMDGKLRLVAGNRRYNSANRVLGAEYLMPAMVAVMTDEEADLLATTENTARVNMSPTEEAVAAANVLGTAKGDRDLASKMLGWSRATLDSRLALMNCTPAVRTALNRREINLGHAELLATLPKTSQDKLLPVIIQEKRTVSEIKQVIANAACKLESAIFDKAECVSCPHNSTLQKSMFAENIGDGGCTNPGCYTEKTDKALQGIVDGLKDEYPVIRIVRVGDNNTRIKLVADGATGVGKEQAQACRSCQEFGAAVSALPDAMGKVFKDQCFNTGCNSKKVAARIAAEKTAKETASKPKETSGAGDKPTKEAPAGKPAAEKALTSVTESERVKTYRVKVWREAMKAEIAKSPELSVQYLIGLVMSGQARNIDESAISKAFGKLTSIDVGSDLKHKLDATSKMTAEQAGQMTTLLAASAMSNIETHYLRVMCQYHKLDLSKHWKLDAEFLDLLTKSEIDVVAKEVKLDKQFGDGFKKLFSEKKDELIKKLLSVEGFDYAAIIPKVMRP